jgi:hypothetical protein
MRKTLASRIVGLAALYCIVLFFVVILQFSNKENFTLSAGGMTIRGRYLQQTAEQQTDTRSITNGVKLFYGGLDFTLREEHGKGLMLSGRDGTFPVNPESILITENSARFILPGGTVLVFNSFDSARGRGLQINAEFANNVSEVTIPITPRRSSTVRDNGQVGIMFGGSRYFFSSPGLELENGRMVLSRDNSFLSYQYRSRQRVFNPSDYIIARAQNYESIVRTWRDTSFTHWNQNITSLFQNEDDVIAYLTEAFGRGSHLAAINAVSADFINNPRRSYRASAFVGGTANAYQSLISSQNEKINMITRLTRERSLAFLREEHLLDYLFVRGYTALANDVIEIITSAEPQKLTIDYCAGLLEFFTDVRRWRQNTVVSSANINDANYPIGHLIEQMLLLISDNLNRDNENDAVYVAASDGINLEYSLRLGRALITWAQISQNTEWAAIGRSLVLSALTGSNSGRLYNTLRFTDYYPRGIWLTNEGHWVWTVSQTARASYIEGNLNIAFSFPVNASHYVMIRGVRPFIKIQIHGMDWRTDNQFERYDSSGWVYYPQEQILVVKLRHRAAIENVRIFYRVDEPPAVVGQLSETGENTEGVPVE